MVIITGVGGFIGQKIFEYCSTFLEETVLGFDIKFNKEFYIKNENDLFFHNFEKDSNIDFINLILSRRIKVDEKITFYHFASNVGVANHTQSTIKSQLILNSNIYEILLHLKDTVEISLVFASTSELYGEIRISDAANIAEFNKNPNGYLHKNFIFANRVRNEYCLQKGMSEKLFANLNLKDYRIFRYFNVFGAGQDINKGINAKILDYLYSGISLHKFKLFVDGIRTYTPILQAVIESIVLPEDTKDRGDGKNVSNMKDVIYEPKVKNIIGKYPITNLDLFLAHNYVKKFIEDYNFKNKDYNEFICLTFLQKMDKDIIKHQNRKFILEETFPNNSNNDLGTKAWSEASGEDTIFDRKIGMLLSFVQPKETEKEFLVELLKYHFNFLHNIKNNIKINKDYKFYFVGELIKDSQLEYEYAIQELDSNPLFAKKIEGIPYSLLTEDYVLNLIREEMEAKKEEHISL